MSEWYDRAKDLGWEFAPGGEPNIIGPQGVQPGSTVIIERGDERIEVTYGSGGLPRSINRKTADGKTHTIPFNYIRTAEIVDWMSEGDHERGH